MIVLHSFMVDKDYSELQDGMDIELMQTLEEANLPEGFYGGAVTHVAKLRNSKITLLINAEYDGLQVVDVAVTKLEDLEYSQLRELAKSKGLDFKPVGMTKEAFIDLIKGYTLDLN